MKKFHEVAMKDKFEQIEQLSDIDVLEIKSRTKLMRRIRHSISRSCTVVMKGVTS